MLCAPFPLSAVAFFFTMASMVCLESYGDLIHPRKYKCENIQVDEIHRIICDGVMRKHWNGLSEHEKLSAQRKGWAAKAVFKRNEHLIAFNELTQEQEEGQEEWKGDQEASGEIKGGSEARGFETEVKVLRLEIDTEKQNHCDWVSRRGKINTKLQELRTGPLKGVQIQGQPLPIVPNSVTPIPASTGNSNDFKTLDSRSDKPTSNMALYLTETDTQMDSHPGLELDPELEPNYEHESTFIWSLFIIHSPFSLVNGSTLQTDDTNPGFRFNIIGLASTTPTHLNTDLLQMMAAPAILPSESVPGPAVLTPVINPAVRRASAAIC
ncbi:hypothetical protein B0H14DRAFT_2625992 [Mycena olivaceomarginata]|nr:hypothetical protein B0H14DRAFT_2625992 [Mycena olivaceomarginata]